MSEFGELQGPDPRRFELIVQRPELQGFEAIQPTEFTTLSDGHVIATKCDVIFPDGTVRREHDTDEIMYVLMPHGLPDIPPIVVTIERAAHVKFLHLDGSDSGSVFLQGLTIEDVLRDVSEYLPEIAVKGNYDRSSFDVNMGRDYGWENLTASWDALAQGQISEHDFGLLNNYQDKLLKTNLNGTLAEKHTFVNWFNKEFSTARIFMQVIREQDGGVVVPHMYGEPHLTASVMIALSTRRPGPNKKNLRTVRHLHTVTPGRAMGKHPIPGQHRIRGDRERLDMKSFRESAYNWTHHILILPWPDVEAPTG